MGALAGSPEHGEPQGKRDCSAPPKVLGALPDASALYWVLGVGGCLRQHSRPGWGAGAGHERGSPGLSRGEGGGRGVAPEACDGPGSKGHGGQGWGSCHLGARCGRRPELASQLSELGPPASPRGPQAEEGPGRQGTRAQCCPHLDSGPGRPVAVRERGVLTVRRWVVGVGHRSRRKLRRSPHPTFPRTMARAPGRHADPANQPQKVPRRGRGATRPACRALRTAGSEQVPRALRPPVRCGPSPRGSWGDCGTPTG